jgi:short-subunit dehydrogenase
MSTKAGAAQAARSVAVVTGASSGIGACFARRLAARGMDLVVVARRRERLEALAAEIRTSHGSHVDILEADLTNREALASVAAFIGGIENLAFIVNSAGFAKGGVFAQADPKRIEDELYLDLIAVALLTRAALPAMIARGAGTVINISSTGGFNPSPSFATYAAAKAGVILLTQALSHELHGTGVRVQTLCPGPVPTEFSRIALGNDDMPVPRALLQSVDDCVDTSLRALERGPVTLIPHLPVRMLTRFIQILPLAWRLRILGGTTTKLQQDAA